MSSINMMNEWSKIILFFKTVLRTNLFQNQALKKKKFSEGTGAVFKFLFE